MLETEIKKEIQNASANIPGYQDIRQKISFIVNEISHISDRHGINIVVQSGPPPAIRAPYINVNIFYSVLHDNSYGGISRQMVLDTINSTIGACENDLKKDFYNLFNPFHWFKTIIRLPFIIISLSGFDISKFEDHLLSRLFKLTETILIIYILIKLGFSHEEIKQAIIKFIMK